MIVAPNNDTLYSMAHLDLSKGPLVLHVPAVAHHHYYVFEFLDPYTNVFHYVGTRTTGDGAGNYAIVGPKFHGKLPGGVHRIRSTLRARLDRRPHARLRPVRPRRRRTRSRTATS